MRLVRIEAERFGRIDGTTLGGLSPGLSVVVGPNEAGKSSLTALVRYVLYGFPTPADGKEPPYLSRAGKREARLVFSDGDGEWVVERGEGPHGGTPTVRTLSGQPRDNLVDELTRGVSKLAYHVVLGFGLADMQRIERLKGKDDDLLSRLYAAGAGLAVSPPDVRRDLAGRMEALWKKGGSNPAINRRKAERDALRSRMRDLDARAEAFASDTQRLRELEAELELARARREETARDMDRLARAAEAAERLCRESDEARERAAQLERTAGEEARAADGIVVDERALAAAEAVDDLRMGVDAFEQRRERLAAEEVRLSAAVTALRQALDDAGWSEGDALSAAADAGIAASVEASRREIEELRVRAKVAAEQRATADARTGTPDAAALRRAWLRAGVAGAALGLAGVVAGLVSRQTALTVFGAVVAALGAGAAGLLGRRAGAPASTGEPRTASSGDAASRELDSRLAAWAAWVRDHGLGDGSEEPAAIAARLDAARSVRASDRERAAARASIDEQSAHVDAYVSRVATAVAPLIGPAASVSPETAAGLVRRGAEIVEDARRARVERERRATAAARAAAEAVAATALSTEKAAEWHAGLEAVGVEAAGVEAAREAARAAASEAADTRDAFDATNQRVSELRARLAEERRHSERSALRLDEESLTQAIAEDVDTYAVLALADRLLALAQERYERDRQPEVVKRAQAEFSRMTNGRYPRLTVPLGKDDIEVFDARDVAVSPGQLSRGTAEQLYLALRLGLIDQLGDAGRGLPILMDDVLVNFSPERLEAAARAIAGLAERRQVVFFTCHPGMADLFARVAPDAARLELPA